MLSIGVLALQGDFKEHLAIIATAGARGFEVRTRSDLEMADAIIIPGGESTTMLKLIDRNDLRDVLHKHIEQGMPVFGTCAGAILLATEVSDGEAPLQLFDMTITRNAYGRQVDSFEAEIEVTGLGLVHGAFIRAPVIDRVGPQAKILAVYGQRPVLVRQEKMVAATFHPEIAGDPTIHRWFVEEVCR